MTDNLRGIVAVLIGSTAFVLNDATVKLLTAELPSGEILIVRGIIATAMMGMGVIVMGAMRPLAVLFQPMMLVRLITAAAATTFIVISLRYLPLPTLTVVLQVTPLAVTAGAAIVYGEKVGWRRWLAALAGFVGVALIVKPGGGFGAAAFLALLCLFFTTTRDITTRGLARDIPSILVAAASSLYITLAGFFVVPFDDAWHMPSNYAWGLMAISAVCLFVANVFMVIAIRTGEIAVVAPFRYAPVPLSLLLGYWWWGDVPDTIAFVGIGLVLLASLYTLHRERRSLRAAAPRAAERSPAE